MHNVEEHGFQMKTLFMYQPHVLRSTEIIAYRLLMLYRCTYFFTALSILELWLVYT